jgi:hypothetical protein
MQHIDDIQLQAFIDGELGPDACHAVEQHIAECRECCAKLDDCQCLCTNLRALVPDDDLFRSEGEFWACLAGRLKPTCTTTWPWLTSLPPVLLGALGLTLDVLISITLALYALTGLGITSSPGTALAAWLPGALGAPALEPLYAALGWSQSVVSERLTSAWNVLGSAGQDFLVFALFLVLVGALLGTVLTLYFSWVFFMHGREAR